MVVLDGAEWWICNECTHHIKAVSTSAVLDEYDRWNVECRDLGVEDLFAFWKKKQEDHISAALFHGH
jgi:diphthamide synthase (EF-2-diphthine--ammonia ligase)